MGDVTDFKIFTQFDLIYLKMNKCLYLQSGWVIFASTHDLWHCGSKLHVFRQTEKGVQAESAEEAHCSAFLTPALLSGAFRSLRVSINTFPSSISAHSTDRSREVCWRHWSIVWVKWRPVPSLLVCGWKQAFSKYCFFRWLVNTVHWAWDQLAD